MFGYVKPYVPELRVAEYELFRAVYCGVCRAMGSRTGTVSRFTLSYDYVFLAAVRMALSETVPVLSARRCIAHPAKKRKMAEENPALSYTAAAAACMLAEKLADDVSDEGGLKKTVSVMSTPFVNRMVHRAGEENAPDPSVIRELTAGLYRLEEQNAESLDETAEAFGAVLAYVFSDGLTGNAKTVASEIGRAAGRFVYVADAADDLVDDVKRGRYNPIERLFGDMAIAEEDGKPTLSEVAADSVRTATRLDLARLGLAAELLPMDNPLTPIIKNIVYLGMPASLDKVLNIRNSERNESSSH